MRAGRRLYGEGRASGAQRSSNACLVVKITSGILTDEEDGAREGTATFPHLSPLGVGRARSSAPLSRAPRTGVLQPHL
jgi:hypothetical protein